MDRKIGLGFTLTVALGVVAPALAQQAVQWRVEDGGNGHWYARLGVTGTVPPIPLELGAMAVNQGGYLVSYHSVAEELFALDAFGPTMVGLIGNPGVSSFFWHSGESITYSNWGCCGCNFAPYPNNSSSTARLVFQSAYPGCTGTQGFGPPWDDYPLSDWRAGINRSEILIEWSADCNADGIVDYGQILDGTFLDLNDNGVPDICEVDPCPGDVNSSGVVNGTDIAIILGAWGTSGGKFPRSDANRDGVVDAADLSIVLAGWGPCP